MDILDEFKTFKKNLGKENQARDQVALQALLRVAALEQILIDKGLIEEGELVQKIEKLSDDFVQIVKSSVENKGDD